VADRQVSNDRIVKRVQPEHYPSLTCVETAVVPPSPITNHVAIRVEQVEGRHATIALPQTGGTASIPAGGDGIPAVDRFIHARDPGTSEWLLLKSFDETPVMWEGLRRDLSQLRP
jgi:hypothetical protein